MQYVQYGVVCFGICTQTSVYAYVIIFDRKWVSPVETVKLAIKNMNN